MEDASQNTKKNPPADKQKKQLKTPSTLSQNLDSKAIIDQILSTPIPLSIGNVIGLSKEVSQNLQEMMKPKCVNFGLDNKPQSLTAESLLAITHADLIRVPVTSN
ncbi:hypothetical protein SERLA73DRAFT_187377, partial [Serpula lacrymans var. lacrymans S7.3]